MRVVIEKQSDCTTLIDSRDVTFIHLGNKTKVDGDLVNFEKLRMLAKEIRNLNNMCSAPLDLMSMLEQVRRNFLKHF